LFWNTQGQVYKFGIFLLGLYSQEKVKREFVSIKRLLLLGFLVAFLVYPTIIVYGHPEEVVSADNETEHETISSEPPEQEIIVIPNSAAKRTANEQLKGTGLIFMPFPDSPAIPAQPRYEEYQVTEPVIILPQENNETNEKGGGKQNNE
jgi:hypothetical protein